MYRVMQAHGQDLSEGADWVLLAEFDSMELAEQFADAHYQTQVFTPSEILGSCPCEDCRDGLRDTDWQAMSVEIQIQATAYTYKGEK